MKKIMKKVTALILVCALCAAIAFPPKAKATGLEPLAWTAATVLTVVIAGVAAYGIGWAFRNFLQGTLTSEIQNSFIEFANSEKPFGETVVIVDWAGVVQQFNAKYPQGAGPNPLKPNGKVVLSAVLMGLFAQYAQWLKTKNSLEDAGTEQQPQTAVVNYAVGARTGNLIVGFYNASSGTFRNVGSIHALYNMGTVSNQGININDVLAVDTAYRVYLGDDAFIVPVMYRYNSSMYYYVYIFRPSGTFAGSLYCVETLTATTDIFHYVTISFYNNVNYINAVFGNANMSVYKRSQSEYTYNVSASGPYEQFFNPPPGSNQTQQIVASYMWNYDTNLPAIPSGESATITPQYTTPVSEILSALDDLSIEIDNVQSTLGNVMNQIKPQTIALKTPDANGDIQPDAPTTNVPISTIMNAIGAVQADPTVSIPGTASDAYENVEQAVESAGNKPIIINGNPYDLETLKEATQGQDLTVLDGDNNPHIIAFPDIIEFISPQSIPDEVPEKQILKELELPSTGTDVPVTTPMQVDVGEPEVQPTAAPSAAPTSIPTAAPSTEPSISPSESPDPTATPIPVVDTPTLPDGTEIPALRRLGDVMASVFPFSIPWDVAKGLELFSAQPQAPVFVFDPFQDSILPDSAAQGSGYSKYALVIDFAEQEWIGGIAAVTRWASTIMFLLSLALGTRRLIWK